MQTNSQGHRDSFAPKTVLPDDIPDARTKSRANEAVNIEKKTAAVSGVVTDCLRLNIRKEPSLNGEVLAVIDALSEVMVDIGSSSEAFYKVCTVAGIEGFCMKKYIALRR